MKTKIFTCAATLLIVALMTACGESIKRTGPDGTGVGSDPDSTSFPAKNDRDGTETTDTGTIRSNGTTTH